LKTSLLISVSGLFHFQARRQKIRTEFMSRMIEHAETKLGMVVSRPLLVGWKQLETACNAVSTENDSWQVLQLPTGSGKTQALAVLCAHTVVSASNPPGADAHTQHLYCGSPGILIVTRYKCEANQLADVINEVAGTKIAVASHGDVCTSAEQLAENPVLVITHAGYQAALREIKNESEQHVQWDRITRFHNSTRQWVVVDEALDWVDSYQCDLVQLSAVSGALTALSKREHVTCLAALISLVQSIVDGLKNQSAARAFTVEEYELLGKVDVAALLSLVARTQTNDLQFDPAIVQSPNEVRKSYSQALKTLAELQGLSNLWVSRCGKRIQIHGSRLLMDASPFPGVILDATAGIDGTYDVLGSRVTLIPRPEGIRSYSNVTLHVSQGHPVGKEHLKKNAEEFWPKVSANLSVKLSGTAKSLIVCHMDVEKLVRPKLSTGTSTSEHWGNLDGRNDWNDYDVGVFFGLPYLDDIVPTNITLACQPQLLEQWFDGVRKFDNYADIAKAIKDGFVAKSVIQALNRIRCRKVIDGDGNCEAAELYMLTPKGQLRAKLLETVASQMPGIIVQDWSDLELERPKLPAVFQKLLAVLANSASGMHSKSNIVEQIAVSERTFQRWSKAMQQPSTAIYEGLASIGVKYHCEIGRGKEAYFMKS
jgi:hypothetical protein